MLTRHARCQCKSRQECAPAHRGIEYGIAKPQRPSRIASLPWKSTRGPQPPAASTTRAAPSSFYTNSDGLNLEWISAEVSNSTKPGILFVHGAGHGAWCWQDKFMPYFKEAGFTSHALSLRGQAKSDVPEGAKAGGTLESHSQDLAEFISTNFSKTPFLIGHSFGGLVVQNYILKDYEKRPKVAGVVLLGSAPPQGNQHMIGRFFRKNPFNSIRLTWTFIVKSYLKKPEAMRWLFFSDDLPDHDLNRYFSTMRENECQVPLVEVSQLKQEVPLPQSNSGTPRVLVIGGDKDATVDLEGFQETAGHYGAEPVIISNLAHDIMLDVRWQTAAKLIQEWMDMPEKCHVA